MVKRPIMEDGNYERILAKLKRKRRRETDEEALELLQDLDGLQQIDSSMTYWHCGEMLQPCSEYRVHLLLGLALKDNTSLRRLKLSPRSRYFADSYILAEGIGQSRLTSLTISPDNQMVSSEAVSCFWENLYQGLQASKTIRELRLCPIPVVELTGFGAALPMMKSLRRLVMKDLVLTERGAQALGSGIGQSKLKCVKLLPHIQEQPVAAGRIRRIFYEGMQSSRKLPALCFPSEEIVGVSDVLLSLQLPTLSIRVSTEHHLFPLLSALHIRTISLKHLRLCGALGEQSIALLAQGLAVNVTVKSLSIQGFRMRDQDMNVLFANGLRRNTSVAKLTLSSCEINDSGIRLIASNWFAGCRIRYLSLPSNEFGLIGAQLLLGIVQKSPILSMLDISYNRNVGYEGLATIGRNICHQENLIHFRLQGCYDLWWGVEVQDKIDKKAKADKAKKIAGQALIEGIKQNAKIKSVDVRRNDFPLCVESEIGFYVALNKMGAKHLLSTDHELACSFWCHILANCHRKMGFGPSLIFYFLKEQQTLVRP